MMSHSFAKIYQNFTNFATCIPRGTPRKIEGETETLLYFLQILFLKKGEISGYSACFVAKNDNTKIAVVGIGYGDGIFRNIQNKGYVLINNSFAKIVAVCMDCLIVDVTNISAKVGDTVTLIGRNGDKQIFVCDVASWCDTISYEIMVRLSGRIKRKYIRG